MHLPPHPDGRVDDRSGMAGAPTGGCPPLVVTDHGRVFEVAGELDMATAPVLEDRVADVVGSIRLDLEALTFIDSAGIAAFIHLYRRCETDGCTLRIERCCPQVERTLRIAGVYDVLTGDPR
jgi:anti-sigma B factor antagonist